MSGNKTKPSLPYGWEVHQSTSIPERVYYYNRNTGDTSWNCPQLICHADSSEGTKLPLPPLLANPPVRRSLQNRDKESPKPATLSSQNAKSPPCAPSSSSNEPTLTWDRKTEMPRSEQKPELLKRLKRPTIEVEATAGPEKSSVVQNGRYGPYKRPTIPVKAPSPQKEKTVQAVKRLSNGGIVENIVKPSKNLNVPACTKSNVSGIRVIKTAIHRITPITTVSTAFSSSKNLNVPACTKSNVSGNRVIKTAIHRITPITTVSTASSSSFVTSKINAKHKQVSPVLPQRQKHSSVMNCQAILKPSTPDSVSDVEMLDLSDDCINVPSKSSYHIVVDTNVLIHELNFVDELKDTPLEGCGPPIVVVPYVVLKELDNIKNNRDKSKSEEIVQKANEAVRYIYELFAAKHPRFCGQNSLKVPLEKGTSLDANCNDDMILFCCIQMFKKASRDKVVLLTNDKNLCNKAMVQEIKAYTTESIYNHLEVDFHNASNSSKPGNYTLKCGIPSAAELTQDNQLRQEVDRIMVLAKTALKKTLGDFLQNVMKEVYKELWPAIVYIKPPWSLLNILDCLLKHWVAVFTQVLNNPLQTNVKQIRSTLKAAKNYIYDEQQALDLVNNGLPLCAKIIETGSESAKDSHAQLLLLQKELQCLGQNNPAKNSSDVVTNNKRLRSSSGRNSSEQGLTPGNNMEESWPKIPDESCQRVKLVFQHVWNSLNHLCGIILDSLEVPHKLEYQRRSSLPSKEETDRFMPIIYPQMTKLRKYMMNVTSTTNFLDESFSQNVKGLFMQLHVILPELNIPDPLPATISEEDLKLFCTNENNRDLLQGGWKQLSVMFSLIHKCAMGTAKRT